MLLDVAPLNEMSGYVTCVTGFDTFDIKNLENGAF